MKSPEQTDLFPQETATRPTLSELVVSAAKPADKNQAKLQRLIKDIEKQRQLLQAWQEFLPLYQQKVQNEFIPLEQACWNTQRDIVLALDLALKTKGMLRGKAQQADAACLIVGLSRELLAIQADDTLEALHDEYSELSHSEHREVEQNLEQEVMAFLFGGSPEDYGSKAKGLHEASHFLNDNADAESEESAAKPRARRPTKRQAAQAQLAKEASQSVRQVFRSLASKLHPDRENDPAERERKTALMQRVNQAYAAQDLLELLSLQYEIEQIDPQHLNHLEAKRAAEYIYVFDEQLKELKQEIKELTAPFRHILSNYSPTLHPQMVSQAMSTELAEQKSVHKAMQQDLDDCRHPDSLKRWLKANRPSRRDD